MLVQTHYCPQAWQAWLSGKVVYPISPTAEELAILIEDRNYIGDKTTFSVKEITGFSMSGSKII